MVDSKDIEDWGQLEIRQVIEAAREARVIRQKYWGQQNRFAQRLCLSSLIAPDVIARREEQTLSSPG